jgi:hypothetical protein
VNRRKIVEMSNLNIEILKFTSPQKIFLEFPHVKWFIFFKRKKKKKHKNFVYNIETLFITSPK